MAVKVHAGRLCVHVNSSLREAREKVRVLDSKIHTQMEMILMSKTASDFTDLEISLAGVFAEIAILDATTEKKVSVSYEPERWRSVLSGINVLVNNVHIVKSHVIRFKKFASMSERADLLWKRLVKSVFLDDGPKKLEHAKVKEEFDLLSKELFAMIDSFSLCKLLPCQEESYDRLIDKMEDLKALILKL